MAKRRNSCSRELTHAMSYCTSDHHSRVRRSRSQSGIFHAEQSRCKPSSLATETAWPSTTKLPAGLTEQRAFLRTRKGSKRESR